jgi:hypothetical protein
LPKRGNSLSKYIKKTLLADARRENVKELF